MTCDQNALPKIPQTPWLALVFDDQFVIKLNQIVPKDFDFIYEIHVPILID